MQEFFLYTFEWKCLKMNYVSRYKSINVIDLLLCLSLSTLINDVTTLFQIDCMMQVGEYVRVKALFIHILFCCVNIYLCRKKNKIKKNSIKDDVCCWKLLQIHTGTGTKIWKPLKAGMTRDKVQWVDLWMKFVECNTEHVSYFTRCVMYLSSKSTVEKKFINKNIFIYIL